MPHRFEQDLNPWSPAIKSRALPLWLLTNGVVSDTDTVTFKLTHLKWPQSHDDDHMTAYCSWQFPPTPGGKYPVTVPSWFPDDIQHTRRTAKRTWYPMLSFSNWPLWLDQARVATFMVMFVMTFVSCGGSQADIGSVHDMFCPVASTHLCHASRSPTLSKSLRVSSLSLLWSPNPSHHALGSENDNAAAFFLSVSRTT